jgi:hypothetical protein
MFIPATPNTFAPSMRQGQQARNPLDSLVDRPATMRSPFEQSPMANAAPQYQQSPVAQQPQLPQSRQSVWQYAPAATMGVTPPISQALLDDAKSESQAQPVQPAAQTPEEEEKRFYTFRDMFPGYQYNPTPMPSRQIDPLMYQQIAPIMARR